MDIVVARYNEDISWVDKFKKSRLFIYDKGDEINDFIKLPNIGRESHTYLTHIVNNYDNLSDYTTFLQGNPYDGSKGHLNRDPDYIESPTDIFNFMPLSYMLRCDLNGNPHHPNLEVDKIIFDKYFTHKPEYIEFCVGAQFIVSKRAILNRSKYFYSELLNEFSRVDIDNSLTGGGGNTPGNKMPWVLERVWSYIFNLNYVSKI